MKKKRIKKTPAEKKLTGAIMLIGDALTCPDVKYATGFRAVDPVVFVRNGSRRFLVVPQLEVGRAEREAPGVDIVTPQKLGLVHPPRRGRLSDWALELLKREKIRSVAVPSTFPHGVAERLKSRKIRVSVARTSLFPERAVKRPDEIRKIKETQQAAVIAMRAAVEQIATSEIDPSGYLVFHGRRLTSADVRLTITRALLEHGCISNETIVAGGMQAVDPHEQGEGPLKAREAIVIDIFPKNLDSGYWGDISRTVVKGKAPASLRTMYQAVKAAQTVALNRVRAGVKAASVHSAAVEEFERRGFKTEMVDGKGSGFVHSTGHGVGLAIHEAPSLGIAPGRLRSGNVVTVEPGLYYPGIGGIRVEDTIVVTSSGWRYLAPCEKRFEV